MLAKPVGIPFWRPSNGIEEQAGKYVGLPSQCRSSSYSPFGPGSFSDTGITPLKIFLRYLEESMKRTCQARSRVLQNLYLPNFYWLIPGAWSGYSATSPSRSGWGIHPLRRIDCCRPREDLHRQNYWTGYQSFLKPYAIKFNADRTRFPVLTSHFTASGILLVKPGSSRTRPWASLISN